MPCRFALETKSTPSGQPRRAKGRDVDSLVPWPEADKPSRGKQSGAGVRYRDGFPVASKGEKHVEVALKGGVEWRLFWENLHQGQEGQGLCIGALRALLHLIIQHTQGGPGHLVAPLRVTQ